MAMSTPAKVGVLTLVTLIALGMLIIWKTEIFMVRGGYQMMGTFKNIEGLTVGSEVRYRGLKVGKVMKIDVGPADIKVYSVINKGIRFPDDSDLRVAYDGIVGQKYLEIKPGTSEAIYKPSEQLYGIKTAAIVDFVDIAAQNLAETKEILINVRRIIENPKLQKAFMDTVYTANKIANDLEKLTYELRRTNQGISDIVNDPAFQANIKGTIKETEKTLSAANKFFDTVGDIKVRVSGGVDVGSLSNAVKANLDIVQSDTNYLRFGIGEGPTRQISVLDLLFSSRVSDDFGYRLGVINNQLGGGVAFYPSEKTAFKGDIYDINNETTVGGTTTRLWPKIRLGYEYELRDYMNLAIKGDDLLNEGDRNFTIGILVKPPGSRIY